MNPWKRAFPGKWRSQLGCIFFVKFLWMRIWRELWKLRLSPWWRNVWRWWRACPERGSPERSSPRQSPAGPAGPGTEPGARRKQGRPSSRAETPHRLVLLLARSAGGGLTPLPFFYNRPNVLHEKKSWRHEAASPPLSSAPPLPPGVPHPPQQTATPISRYFPACWMLWGAYI